MTARRSVNDVIRFYGLIEALRRSVGSRKLSECSGRMLWPQRGVYFFFEDGEVRSESGVGPRVVRVGTHALTATSRTTLWDRLSQHRGSVKTGAGNHRGSIFRLLVGEALLRRNGESVRTWGVGQSLAHASNAQGLSRAEVKAAENEWERAVSRSIGAMECVWLDVSDAPGSGSARAFIERNAIALLSNLDREPVDPPSGGWLGRSSGREQVRRSGLWNNQHVAEPYDRTFLDQIEECARTPP